MVPWFIQPLPKQRCESSHYLKFDFIFQWLLVSLEFIIYGNESAECELQQGGTSFPTGLSGFASSHLCCVTNMRIPRGQALHVGIVLLFSFT